MISSKERREDVSFLLLLVPFAVSGLYGLVLWVITGVSAILPPVVFLQVTESPYVFLIGFAAVLGGVVLDVVTQDPRSRKATLTADSNRIQILAVVALVLALLFAWYSAGFDPGAAAAELLQGRYTIIFPVLLIAFSFVMLPSVTLSRNQVTYLVFIILFLAIPLSIDELGKRSFVLGMGLGVVLLILAIYVYLRGQAKDKEGSGPAAVS
jgi:hypothetical protein